MLLCRLVRLGRRRMPDLTFRTAAEAATADMDVDGGMAMRVVVAPAVAEPETAAMPAAEAEAVPKTTLLAGWSAIWPAEALASKMLPWPEGEGNWASLNSVEADSMLLCNSSKLTDGRKSNVLRSAESSP